MDMRGWGIHFIQEDGPHEIGAALNSFVRGALRGNET
jgi:hypothetical protein